MGNRGAKDLETYRDGYPQLKDDENATLNYKFYNGEIQSTPSGDFIDNIHKDWWGDTEKLEVHHGYIQWLFPIREHGMNFESQPLQKHEIEKMKKDETIMKRLKKSYEMMMDFYGAKVNNYETGELILHPTKWKEQFKNLRTHSHNYLRITRILKCLGEFELTSYQKSLLDFFIPFIFKPDETGNVLLLPCQSSCENFWIGTIKNNVQRNEYETKINNLKNEFNKFYQPPKTPYDKIKQSNRSLKTSYDDDSETETDWDPEEVEDKYDDHQKSELIKLMKEEEEDQGHDDDNDFNPVGHIDIKEEPDDAGGSKEADDDKSE